MVEIQGTVFNIQRFSIKDGPGIRTTVFFKGCPLRCLWCSNPESQAVSPQLFYWKSLCVNCCRCIQACPTGATQLDDHNHIKINRDLCKACGRCVEVCIGSARAIAEKMIIIEEVMDVVKKDVLYYRNSEGGVTLSGGEPTYQSQFAVSILRQCHEYGIHTALDTCGYASWENFRSVLDDTDLVLFDIKYMDSGKHKELTGVSNELILNNFEKVVQAGTPVIVRVPLIPGLNDSKNNISQLGEFVARTGVLRVDLIPSHHFGRGKYQSLGQDYKVSELREYEDQEVEDIQAALKAFRLEVQIS